MAKVINTSFDDTVEESVALEQIDGKEPPVQTTLKNAENVYKSFLYLKKMYSMFPQKQQIVKSATVNYSDFTEVRKPLNANFMLINSIDGSDNVSIKINGGEFSINPRQTIEFPVVPATEEDDGDLIEMKGKISFTFKISQEY